jgi:hypothetical protein
LALGSVPDVRSIGPPQLKRGARSAASTARQRYRRFIVVSSVAIRVPRRLWTSTVAAAVLASSLLVTGVSATSVRGPPNGDTVGPVEVSGAVHSDVSAPLSSLVGVAPPASTGTRTHEMPLRVLPNMGNALNQADGALQTSSGPLVPTTSLFPPFAGIGDTSNTPLNPCNCAPPDTNGAVGATQYVQWVNTAFAVYDKTTGSIVLGPVAGNTLWAGFVGGCQDNSGDPVVQYDKANNRWIFTQFSVSTAPYLQCVAVSTTSDARGPYNRYAYSFGAQFPDYPKLGVWPDGYYMSFNIFTNGSTWAGAKVCALDGSAMRAGTPASMECFQLTTSYGSLLPSDLDGTNPAPTGSPDYFMNFGSNSLNLWKFHADFGTPLNATFTGPTNIPVAAFSAACSGGGACIPQPGTSNRLDSLGDRLMYRLAYRNLGNGVESLLVNHSVTVSGNRRSSLTGVRWYEIRTPNGTPTVYQQGTFAPDSTSRWMGSIAMDKVGDIALGYSASSGSVYPSIRYTGRVQNDPLGLGKMEAENSILAGSFSQTGTLHRWGDYSAMTVDPVDDCTFWYTNEYLPANGSFNWSTRIASFKFPGCQ